jgi:hypothetical protein
LTRYHGGPWSTASPRSTRPVRQPALSTRRHGRASDGSAFGPRARSRRRRPARPCSTGRPVAFSPVFAGAGVRFEPPARVARRMVGRGRWSRCTGRGPAAPERIAGRAPPWRRGAAEEHDRHIRRRDRRSVRA